MTTRSAISVTNFSTMQFSYNIANVNWEPQGYAQMVLTTGHSAGEGGQWIATGDGGSEQLPDDISKVGETVPIWDVNAAGTSYEIGNNMWDVNAAGTAFALQSAWDVNAAGTAYKVWDSTMWLVNNGTDTTVNGGATAVRYRFTTPYSPAPGPYTSDLTYSPGSYI